MDSGFTAIYFTLSLFNTHLKTAIEASLPAIEMETSGRFFPLRKEWESHSDTGGSLAVLQNKVSNFLLGSRGRVSS